MEIWCEEPRIELALWPLIDDQKCFEMVRQLRWADGVTCPHCDSPQVTKRGLNETQPDRQRDQCGGCGRDFDDLTNTIFAGHHQPLQVWLLCLYFLRLNLSNRQIARELNLDEDSAHDMATQLREGIVAKQHAVEGISHKSYESAQTMPLCVSTKNGRQQSTDATLPESSGGQRFEWRTTNHRDETGTT